jgi:pyruvate carboxylase
VVFELNGFRREISVLDTTVNQPGGIKAEGALKADPNNAKDIGATLPGMISKLMVSQGATVKENEVVAIIEAMKMETTILSKSDGVIDKIHVTEGQTVNAGDLIIKMS